MFKKSRSQVDQTNSPLLDDILEVAGESKTQPPLPDEGIPKQWVPRWISFSLKCFILPYILLDGWMQWLARLIIRPPFKRKGQCKKRGNCCYYILIRHSTSFFGRLFTFWQTQINGFYVRYKTPQTYEGKKIHVMGCRYLKKDGSCSQYRLRPGICRSWPEVERFGVPKILKGCGYQSHPPYPQPASEDVFEASLDPRLKVH